MSALADKPAGMWSRRRAAVEAEAAAEEKARVAAIAAEKRATLEAKSDAEILQELDLPDPDTLQAGDDFTAFMKSAVPERLRRRALRKLWVSNPVLANVDNLVDYGEDFIAEGAITGALQTAYQVGKGMLSHVQEMERQAQAEADDGADADQPETAGPADERLADAIEETPAQDCAPAPVQDIAGDVESSEQDETPAFAARRRMRFGFAPQAGMENQ